MADPVSFVASGVGIVDVAFRLVNYLKDVKQAAENIDDDIGGLIREIESLMVVHGQLEKQFLQNIKNESLGEEEKILWFKTGQTLKNGQKLTAQLDESVRYIYGDTRSVIGKRDGLMKQHRKRSKNGMISGFRDQISTYHGALQIWLSFISMHSTREHQENQKSQIEELSALVKGLETKIENAQGAQLAPYEAIATSNVYNDFTSVSLSVLNQIGMSIDNLGKSNEQSKPITNQHFDTPKPVDQFYTGREAQAKQLKEWLLLETSQGNIKTTGDSQAKQKRFVVYGVGGSGKTQFCCKFAEDYQHHFWGVFWVDGSSDERLKQTFSQNVSTIGKVDCNEKAALHWLSKLTKPWLLIIDNADSPNVKLEEYFPRGNRGHILITTRDPIISSYGNVGPKSFEFQGLDNDEASCLLLKAAEQKQPWDSKMSNMAKTIAKALGHLALAITHAGRTIRQGYCRLHEYLEFFERQWKKTRQLRQAVKSRDRGDDLNIFATFELNREAIERRDTEASKDALQLLDTFAFLHNQNIRFNILKRAVTNFEIESKQQTQDKEKEAQARAATGPSDWSTWWRERAFAIIASMYENKTPPVLPSIIRSGRALNEFDPFRLRAALRELTQASLIVHNEKLDSYSIHPLVHKWARERPDMSTADQCVWVEAAAVLLSHSILIPPLGNTTEDEEMRKYLLPHIDHVRACQESIDKRMRNYRMARMRPWPVFDADFNRDKAIQYAKFSIVYAQNGRWDEAKQLQMAVRVFTMKVLGLKHAITRRITLALANTLVLLSQNDDAAALQEEVLEACINHLGSNHPESLVALKTLGESRYLQGRFSDAKKLQEEAVHGLKKLHGHHHEDTLDAIDSLGRTVLMFYTEEAVARARELHLKAVNGMKKVHGHDHLRTLVACENLCKTAVLSGDEDHLSEAHAMMVEVFELRKEKLGKEHGYTLLAMVNLALVKSGLGHLKEAEELIKMGLPIAERNLGQDHTAYLWGRYHLGKIWVKQERWEKAEKQISDVTERQCHLLQGRGRYHPDRIGGLVELATIYNALGKFDECERVGAEALDCLDKISTVEHPVSKKLKDDLKRWTDERKAKERVDSFVT